MVEQLKAESVTILIEKEVHSCYVCDYRSKGMDASECNYFKVAYNYFTPRRGIASWCPFRPENKKT
jgi:hypothetical protein